MRGISLVEMLLAVALAGTPAALVKVGVDHWDYRTMEKIHDELGNADVRPRATSAAR